MKQAICCSVLLTACERADHPRQVASPAETSTAAVTTPAHGSDAPQPRCKVALNPVPAAPVPPAKDCPEPDEPLSELPIGTLWFVDAPEAPVLRIERAETNADRARGLMYRTAMDENAGMLFTWPEERPRSFWMKNTCLPLDMLFIDDEGFIVGILEQVPTLNDEPRRVRCPASRVLEVNAGFCRRHGVEPGQRIRVDF